MSYRKRFGKWIVVACMGALAACTSEGDTGSPAGANELNVIFPNGTTGPFEIGRVTVDVACTGIANDFFGEDPPDGTIFQTDLEFVNTGDATGEVFHGFMDLLGDCSFFVRAFEPDGELFCTGNGGTNVQPGDNDSVTVTLMCDVSQNIDTGNSDLIIQDTVIMVGNFCPFVHSLETIPDEIPIIPPPLQIPNPALDGSRSCSSDADCVGGCDNDTTSPGYLTCFPTPNAAEFQLCALDAANANPAAGQISSCGNRCDVDPDPGNLSFTCTATLPDGSPSQGTFSDPANGGAGQDGDGDPTTYNGWCSNAAIPPEIPITLPVSVGYFICSDAEPGVTVTITCTGGDGDVDCNKSKSADVTCAGVDQCVAQGETCDDGDPCTADICDPVDASCTNPADPGANGNLCTTNPSAPEPGVCDNGACVDAGLCDLVDCSDGNDCTQDVCDPNTGDCSNPPESNTTSCDGGNGTCDGAGTCVDNCANTDCSDGIQCTQDLCDPSTGPGGTCSNPPEPAGAPCDTCNISTCRCDGGGLCEDAPPTFDLSQSVFVAYNTLLPFNPGVCDDPDLDNGGTQCVKVFPPDIRGTVELTETTTGNWDVHIEQTLNSTIPARLDAFNADVIINADSLTVLDGTGTGSVPGTITLDTFTDAVGTQNMVVDTAFPGAGGTAQCLAVVATGATDPCNLTGNCPDPLVPCSECLNVSNGQTCGNLVANECDPVDASGPLDNPLAVCNLAGLPITSCTQWPFNGLALEDSGCFYDLPTDDDNLARLFPDVVVAGTSLQLDGGPTVVGGYYRANAYDPGSGPQWIALAGVQQ